MAAADSHQANGFSADEFSRYIPRQPPNLALDNAWVSLQHRVHSAFINVYPSSGPTRSRQ
jgi:hypothetical protein